VELEGTDDNEWNALVALAETATTLSLDQKDITHRTIAAIAALRIAHEDDWKSYCQRRGMKWPKEAKSPFRPIVAWGLNLAKAQTGENHGSKASMIAGCLDEYWEVKRPGGMKPDDIPTWLSECGGYTKVYRDRLQRLREPKDKIGERYAGFLELKPVEEREIPEWLGGFSGEVVIAAHIDDGARKLQYRSVWRPERTSFWHSRLEQFLAARRGFGQGVDTVCVPTDRDDGDAPEQSTEIVSKAPDKIAVEQLAETDRPQIEPQLERAVVHGKNNNNQIFDAKEIKAATDTMHVPGPLSHLRIVDRLAASVSSAALLPNKQHEPTPTVGLEKADSRLKRLSYISINSRGSKFRFRSRPGYLLVLHTTRVQPKR
jgi:hypothetical protein